jgi:hypothetical protein
MHPRWFRATTIFCLAISAVDVVVAQLPHWHQQADGKICEHSHGAAPTGHLHCNHSHRCSHSHSCSHHPSPPQPAQNDSAPQDSVPCDHCTLCRHQSQAALPVVVAPMSLLCTVCAEIPDQQQAQIAGLTPRVYQGRGPPAWL